MRALTLAAMLAAALLALTAGCGADTRAAMAERDSVYYDSEQMRSDLDTTHEGVLIIAEGGATVAMDENGNPVCSSGESGVLYFRKSDPAQAAQTVQAGWQELRMAHEVTMTQLAMITGALAPYLPGIIRPGGAPPGTQPAGTDCPISDTIADLLDGDEPPPEGSVEWLELIERVELRHSARLRR